MINIRGTAHLETLQNTQLAFSATSSSENCVHELVLVSYTATDIKSTAGADASVEALKLYNMKLLTLAYLSLLSSAC